MSRVIYLEGKSLKGKGLGRIIGFPTINFTCSGKLSGVFLGKVFMKGGDYFAAINVGGRPTIDEEKLCEMHLLDWIGEVEQGTLIKVQLLKKIREVRKFANLEKLKEQIKKDVECARKLSEEL